VVSPYITIENTIKEIFLEGRIDQVKMILQSQTYKVLNPAAIGLNIFEELSVEVKQEVLSSSYFTSITQNGINFLNQIDVGINDGRIIGDMALQSLTNECQRSTPQYLTSLTSLKEEEKSNCSLPNNIQAVIDLIIIMSNSGQDDILKREFIGNTEFIKAFKMELILSKTSSLKPSIRRETALALEVLKDINRSMLKIMTNEALIKTHDSKIVNDIFNQL